MSLISLLSTLVSTRGQQPSPRGTVSTAEATACILASRRDPASSSRVKSSPCRHTAHVGPVLAETLPRRPSPDMMETAFPLQIPLAHGPRRTAPRTLLALLGLMMWATLASAAATQHTTTSAIAQGRTAAYTPLYSTLPSRPRLPPRIPLSGRPDSTAVGGSEETRLRADTAGDNSGAATPGHEASHRIQDVPSSLELAPIPTAASPAPVARRGGTAASPLPSAFDNTPASAFKVDGSDNSCPSFILGLLSNPTFKTCYPLSMMLQTSSSFFQAEKSLVSITRVLDATCGADPSVCGAFLDAAATNLTSRACKKELAQNQTTVLQAYQGLRAYRVLYSATCLRSPKTDQYCFADAVTNLDAPSNNYLYFLPYGLSLPGASSPSCNWCTQQTMAVYHAAAANPKYLVAATYKPAAQQINTLCGPAFVNGTLLPSAAASRAPVRFKPASQFLLALFFIVCALLSAIT